MPPKQITFALTEDQLVIVIRALNVAHDNYTNGTQSKRNVAEVIDVLHSRIQRELNHA
jgi:hypothetical protein